MSCLTRGTKTTEENWGGWRGWCYTASPALRQAGSMCRSFSRPIRSRHRFCPASLPCRPLLDTFIFGPTAARLGWVGVGGAGGVVLVSVPARTTTGITDKESGGGEHPHHTHQRGRMRANVTEQRDDEELFLHVIGWALLETSPHQRQTPKDNNPPHPPPTHGHAAGWPTTTATWRHFRLVCVLFVGEDYRFTLAIISQGN